MSWLTKAASGATRAKVRGSGLWSATSARDVPFSSMLSRSGAILSRTGTVLAAFTRKRRKGRAGLQGIVKVCLKTFG